MSHYPVKNYNVMTCIYYNVIKKYIVKNFLVVAYFEKIKYK
jgi:hypothetical protein